MNFFMLALSEIGLNPLIVIVLIIFGGFFILSFAITSPNMDTRGLLRVLNSKPERNSDGKVEYKEKS